jgi:hypothetical protein
LLFSENAGNSLRRPSDVRDPGPRLHLGSFAGWMGPLSLTYVGFDEFSGVRIGCEGVDQMIVFNTQGSG